MFVSSSLVHMPYHPSYGRRCLLFALSTLVIVGILFSASVQDPNAERPTISQAFTSKDSMKQYIGSLSLPSALSRDCPASCPSDPFMKPGMLYWAPNGFPNETRWLPFPTAGQTWDTPQTLMFEDVPQTVDVPPEAFDSAAPQYTAMLHSGEGKQGEEKWDWMRGRTIVMLDDRNNVEHFCKLTGGELKIWGKHKGAICRVKRLNFVLMSWFLYGMVDTEEIGFPGTKFNEPPNTFERRITDVFLPLYEKAGITNPPDLVILSSLFWDEHFLLLHGEREREKARGFIWNEILWHKHRVRQLIKFVRDTWSQDLPVMFRTRHLRSHISGNRLLQVAQLDQSGRSASRDMGAKLFTWGDRLEGYVEYSDNDQHFGLGPNSYLFGDMALFYLKRATTPGCWACRGLDD